MQASQPEKAEGVPIELLDLAQKRFMQWYQERETERADKSRAIQAENLSGMPPMIGNPQIAKDRRILGKSLPHVRRLTQQGTLAVPSG